MSEEEEDYMSMTLPTTTPATQLKESSLQRRQRLRREAEARARPLSKAEQAAKEAADRDAALSTSLDSSNKGAKMLAKLGFKGGALGKEGGEGRTEPIAVEIREGRGGIGVDAEKKRKVKEAFEAVEEEGKRRKVDEGEYRERVRREREVKRYEAQLLGAMKVAERLDEEDKPSGTISYGGSDVLENGEKEESDAEKPKRKTKPLKGINVLWRGLEKHRLEQERGRRMRHDLQQSLSRLPTYEDPEEDKAYKQAFSLEEEELEEEDPELDEFNAMEPQERLMKLVTWLRETHHYCFWCKFKYPDKAMEGCPGFTEDDHD